MRAGWQRIARCGPGGDPNARALATPPGPSRTYGTPELGARRSLGHVLDDQDGRLVVGRDDDADHAQSGRLARRRLGQEILEEVALRCAVADKVRLEGVFRDSLLDSE
jgi:hypothetical protein